MNGVNDLHDLLKNSPTLWMSSARQFKRTAELIALQIDRDERAAKEAENEDSKEKYEALPIPLWGVDTYLMGVAIENLFKGILQEKGFEFDDLMDFGHNLVKLYHACCLVCGFAEQTYDREILDVLAAFVVWAGRYALPKSPKQLIGRRWVTRRTKYGPLASLVLLNSDELAFSDAERALLNSVYGRFMCMYMGPF